jgi:protein involved in polysaccharide export with SLBB domain
MARAANTSTNNPAANLPSNRARTVSNTTTKPAANNSSVSPLGASHNTFVPANSQIYRIGVRDVLDIQLAGQSTRQSTLFTVIDGGFVEYPLAGGPLVVAGMTAAEVAASLRQRLKILDNPAVVVRVRDYASHTVTISGLVAAPGVKSLRREAVPLYTVLAEALMLPEAARATITRPGHAPILVDLKDSKLTSTLVLPGDAIKVSTTPAEFFFVGGEISSPGQKPYHSGVTLTQAILASGGTTRNAGAKVRVSRQGADGRLLTEEYNLRKIQDGKVADPVLQKGDRIQVSEDR